MSTMVAPVEEAYFAQPGLRRSHSSAKFSNRQPGAFHSSASASRIHDLYQHPVKIFDDSNTSTAPSSPRTIQVSTADLSCSSTPASHLSLSTDNDEDCDESLLGSLDDDTDDIVFPDYNGFHTPTPEELEPPPSPRTNTSDGNDTYANSDAPTPDLDCVPAADDTAVGAQPTRHVDYLSHEWKEEDIWSSWKHIVSNRDGFTNSARLENASWRTWIKAKYHLKTVSPETLNWLKDCDVTWLYGPLLPGKSSSLSDFDTTDHDGLGGSSSFLQSPAKKKPILKKRSMSEVMLQKSLSSSSLIKQAAAAVQAQQRELPKGIRVSTRPRFERAATDYVTFPFSSRRMSKDEISAGPTSVTTGAGSPRSAERKHIHFNESVEQCIAVDLKGEDDDGDTDSFNVNYDSDSDDGMIMMKRKPNKRWNPIVKSRSSNPDKPEKKMLSSLPPTRLKYEGDDDDENSAMKHSYRSPALSPSSSQETLRPSKPSSKLFFADSEDEDEDEEQDDSFGLGLRSPPPGGFGSSSSSAALSSSGGFRRTISSTSLNAAPAGMKRTESGMFMPNDEGETASEGIVGFVLDTVNTAKDIAHVVWNVGWRR